jgi:LysM repeat protein
LTVRPGVGYNRVGVVDTAAVTEERIIPFPATARSHGEPEPLPRRRRETHDAERATPTRRSPRRRRQNTPWLQRNALSVAAVSVLVALLGLGFGLLQLINRPEPSQALLAIPQSDVAASTLSVASTGQAVQLGTVAGPALVGSPVLPAVREIVASTKVIEPNYTVASGDTLGQIATRFSTTVDRIQALNNLPDPRALRIGTKLIIPPAL